MSVFATIARQPNLTALEFVKKHLKDPATKAEAKAAHDAIAILLEKTVVVDAGALLDSKDAKLHGDGIMYEKRADRRCIGNWKNTRAWASWEVTISEPGAFVIEVAQSMVGNPGSEYVVAIGNKQYPVQFNVTALIDAQMLHIQGLTFGYFMLLATRFNNSVNFERPDEVL